MDDDYTSHDPLIKTHLKTFGQRKHVIAQNPNVVQIYKL
jgi:hypothetical protein